MNYALRILGYVSLYGILFNIGVGCQTGESNPKADQSFDHGELTPAMDSESNIAWTEVGPNSQQVIRAIVSRGPCPSLNVDGHEVTMAVRAPVNKEFPTIVCNALLAPHSSVVTYLGRSIPLMKGKIHKIVIIGDTGCRIKSAHGKMTIQKCNDSAEWPFASVAKAAAAEKPDLVIHVGDYHYREASCPQGNKDCAGSISGDNWLSWKADFFEPAKPLLAAAPWIFVRGNHELCTRGGYGWFRFFDPRPYTTLCVDKTPPYWVTFEQHHLAIIDAADSVNVQTSLNSLGKPSLGHTWFLLHRPILTVGADDEWSGDPAYIPQGYREPGTVGMVLAGHKHLMAWNRFSDQRPPELINGNGGTALDQPLKLGGLSGKTEGPGYHGDERYDFGFATLTRESQSQWILQEHDRKGKVVLRCKVTESPQTKTIIEC